MAFNFLAIAKSLSKHCAIHTSPEDGRKPHVLNNLAFELCKHLQLRVFILRYLLQGLNMLDNADVFDTTTRIEDMVNSIAPINLAEEVRFVNADPLELLVILVSLKYEKQQIVTPGM